MKKKTRKIPLFTATLDDMRRESRIRWVLLGLIVAGTIVWMLAGVFQTPLKPDSFTNSRSYSPGGHRALLAMLRDRGYVVQEGFARLRVPEKTNETLVLLEPRPAYVEANPEEFQEAFTTSVFSSGSVLLVLPKRVYRRDGLRTPEGDIPLTWYFLSLAEIQQVLNTAGFGDTLQLRQLEGKTEIVTRDGTLGCQVDDLTVFEAEPGRLDEYQVLLRTRAGKPVALRVQDSGYVEDSSAIVLVSDPDIFSNRYIGRDGAASIVLALFDQAAHGGRLTIDESMHGLATHASLEYLALSPPGIWVTLSLSLLLLLFGWRESTVLRPVAALDDSRRERGYSIEGLARIMRRARDYPAATNNLLRRARIVLGIGAAHVRTSGLPGSSTSILSPRQRSALVSMQDKGGASAERLIEVAREVSRLRRDPSKTTRGGNGNT